MVINDVITQIMNDILNFIDQSFRIIELIVPTFIVKIKILIFDIGRGVVID